jgi:hypothetical protein
VCDALRSLLANRPRVTTRTAAPRKGYGVALDGLFEGNRLEPEAIRTLRRNLERKAIRHAADPTPSVYP